MIQLLARVFIRDYKNYEDPRVRAAYGTLCSGTAIVLNIILSAAKFVVGILGRLGIHLRRRGQQPVRRGSSLIILLGFRFAGKAPHPDHPFGHGRIEYVTGFLVAAIILAAGVQAARSAVERIFHPEDLEVTWAAVIVLVLSILVKVYMGYFNRRLGRKLRSETMLMAGRDALNDTVSTGLALLCLVLYRVSGWNLDAYAGLVVAFLILRTGFQGGKETLSQLLGKKPEPETVKKIEEIVMSFPEILGIHDMVIHDYGPGRFHVSLHAEVDGSGDIYALHDAIDRGHLGAGGKAPLPRRHPHGPGGHMGRAGGGAAGRDGELPPGAGSPAADARFPGGARPQQDQPDFRCGGALWIPPDGRGAAPGHPGAGPGVPAPVPVHHPGG